MTNRHINMRLKCHYEGEKNMISRLEVEHEVGHEWKVLDLDATTPGFDVFVYALLHCQHTYFRINCAERGLLLDRAEGDIKVLTDKDWNLLDMKVNFTGELVSGQASQTDIDFIVARMQQCPVSRNVNTPASAHSEISLVSKQGQVHRRQDPAAVT